MQSHAISIDITIEQLLWTLTLLHSRVIKILIQLNNWNFLSLSKTMNKNTWKLHYFFLLSHVIAFFVVLFQLVEWP